MADILNKCPSCYPINLPECPGVITVNAGLEPNTNYYYVIVDKFQNKYTKKVTTDEDGAFEIVEADLPAGLFNAHAGLFELSVKKNANDCAPQNLDMCGTTYTCVQIQFETVTDVSDDESGSGDASALITIPCDCAEESESGS